MTTTAARKVNRYDKKFQEQIELLQEAQKILQELDKKLEKLEGQMFKAYSEIKYEAFLHEESEK